MKNSKLFTLIMAGGKGTRFWPESTEKKPKQYLSLISSKTLLEETISRFERFIPKDQRFIVTVKEQVAQCNKLSKNLINPHGLIIEPTGRNTAPCIFLSVLTLLNQGASEDDILAIVPSDHVILNKKGFQQTLKKAAEFSKRNKKIVTIGITPNFPHTGFGYIQKGKLVDEEAFVVSRFKEKPHHELAQAYVKSGQYLWNAGMFVAPIGLFLEEFKKHAPELYAFKENLKKVLMSKKSINSLYEKLPADSFDYAVLEKSKNVAVMPANFDWNDLGSWDALSAIVDETHGNTVVKSRGEFFWNSADNVIFAPDKFVTLVNLDKHIVVCNDNVIMIAPLKDSQEIKKVVEQIKIQRPDLI